jgi:hypothetical protein
VNFFAHAFLASERHSDAAFVLGAMLPDLCGFARVRAVRGAPGALGEGVRFHHASDAVFHGSRLFGERCAGLASRLEARGVRRGPARGVAHVGLELLLDGWLARAAGVPRGYRESLERAETLLGEGALELEARRGVAAVCLRVHASPLPEAYVDAAFVCERVERALAQRPFLALQAGELEAVATALGEAALACADWAPSVLAGVRRALDADAADGRRESLDRGVEASSGEPS